MTFVIFLEDCLLFFFSLLNSIDRLVLLSRTNDAQMLGTDTDLGLKTLGRRTEHVLRMSTTEMSASFCVSRVFIYIQRMITVCF